MSRGPVRAGPAVLMVEGVELADSTGGVAMTMTADGAKAARAPAVAKGLPIKSSQAGTGRNIVPHRHWVGDEVGSPDLGQGSPRHPPFTTEVERAQPYSQNPLPGLTEDPRRPSSQSRRVASADVFKSPPFFRRCRAPLRVGL